MMHSPDRVETARANADSRQRRQVGAVLVLLILAGVLVFIAGGCASMRSGLDRVAAPLTENGTRAAISTGAGLVLFVFVPGAELLRASLAVLGTYIVQAATSPPPVIIESGSGPVAPWYLDPWGWAGLILRWLGVAVSLGLVFKRSRGHTLRFLRDLATRHPIRAGKRFAAGMGWLHSDQAEPIDKARVFARMSKDS